MKNRINWNRAAIMGFSLILPPLMAGIFFSLLSARDLMIHAKPQALAPGTQVPDPLPVNGKKAAIIAAGNNGTQISELLVPFEIMAETGLYRPYVAAPKRILSATTASLAFIPHHEFGKEPDSELLIVPSILDPSEPGLVDWLKRKAERAEFVFMLGEGVRTLAQTGLLRGHVVGAPPAALDTLRKSHPGVRWVPAKSYFRDGKWISSSGLGATAEGTLEMIRRTIDLAPFRRAEGAYGKPSPSSSFSGKPELWEYFQIFFRGGFQWDRFATGVVIRDGVREGALANALDPLGRTWSGRNVSLGSERKPVQSANGLTLVPDLSVWGAPSLDLIWIPGGPPVAENSEIAQWLNRNKNLPQLDLSRQRSGPQLQKALTEISARLGPGIATHVSRWINVLPLGEPGLPPAGLWLRALAIGLLGLALARWMIWRWDSRRRG